MKQLSNLFSAKVFIQTIAPAKVCITAAFLLFTVLLSAQTGIIAGKILDAKYADALIGVSFRLDEGAGGAITDFEVNFRIANVPVG